MSFIPNSLKPTLTLQSEKQFPSIKEIMQPKRISNANGHFRWMPLSYLLLSMQGGSLKKELYDAGVTASASAFVQQRSKIPWTVFEDILEQFNFYCKDQKKYKGYRVFAIDGTTVNMARNPKSDSFVKNDSTPKGYNQLHVNPLYDVLNKTYQHCIIQPQPQQDEVGALTVMLKWYDFKEKTLIVADRGYESNNVFAHLMNTPNVDFLIRIKQDRSSMREVRKLHMTELDTDVSFTITTTQTNEDKEKGISIYRYINGKTEYTAVKQGQVVGTSLRPIP